MGVFIFVNFHFFTSLHYAHKGCRFVCRTLVSYPSALYLRVLVGHSFLLTRQFAMAAKHYLMVYEHCPDDPYINLFIGKNILRYVHFHYNLL